MALAVLCTQLKNHDPNYSPRDEQGELILPNYIVENLKHFRLRALVVDHGVRDDSSVEAEKVAGVLKSQCIYSPFRYSRLLTNCPHK